MFFADFIMTNINNLCLTKIVSSVSLFNICWAYKLSRYADEIWDFEYYLYVGQGGKCPQLAIRTDLLVYARTVDCN